MQCKGIEINLRHIPKYDPGFLPMAGFNAAFLAQAKKPIAICIERDAGLRAVHNTFITGTNAEADCYFTERMVKLLLWAKGGFRVTLCGDEAMASYIKRAYSPAGKYAFDVAMMARVYERPFEVVSLPLAQAPAENEASKAVGGKLDGCRIGFDAGGSDRKVSAVIDGKAVFSEEVVWHPKTNADPEYHFNGIVEALKAAADVMPRVDSIGVSSAGIYVGNRTRVASLFLRVSPGDFEEKVKDIYIRAAAQIGPHIPLTVVNDGDVTALAGAMECNAHNVLGIAMGTSQAGGYIDAKGHIKGWLNELAFCPVDASPAAMADEWSGDIGCGVKYFSQDAVIKLARNAGIELDITRPPGENLKIIQSLFASPNPAFAQTARDIFRDMGVYLGHTLPYYHALYGFEHVLLLGRVMSGQGGDIILDTAQQVLAEAYPTHSFTIHTPDEKTRRVGQSVAAAGL
ncbi:MAG: ROK family protein [Defluviitaleaceae bacterium]|nr:ROK family protein [Defluviitaleaceae bacterium]MCL2240790.1 ROK family protein [Defluviitaleaceae bacterium]